MEKHIVWDLFVRIFHWSLVAAFAANALFVDDDSDLHQWLGYLIIALVVLRLVWGFIGSPYARFSSFPPNLKDSVEQLSEMFSARGKIHLGHTPLGALMIYNLLLTMIIIGLSGFLIATDAFHRVDWLEEVHEIAVTWAEICVVAHIAAVLFESYRTKVNLPRAMFTGYKEVPRD
jgi:cytochrome b